MSHLGPLITPLVDGQLSPAKTERLLEHVASCAPCRAEVEAERACRDAARGAGGPRASADLTARLLALQIPGQTPGPLATGAARARPAEGGHPVRTLLFSGAAFSVGVFALALFVLGGQPRGVQDLSPLLDSSPPTPAAFAATRSSSDTTGTPAGSSAALLEWVGNHGWVAPEDLPTGLRVEGVELVDGAGGVEVLRVDLAGSGGEVHVLEQHGVLDPGLLAPLEPVRVGEHDAYLVAEDWWVVQSGDAVVAVSSGADPQQAHRLISLLPVGDPPGVLDRMTDGWSVLVASR